MNSNLNSSSKNKVNFKNAAVINTKLANTRTNLAYIRTGFTIAALAGAFKKNYIVCFGIAMIFGSLIQYVVINKALNNAINKNENLKNINSLDYLPLIFSPLSLIALYLQFYK